MTTTITASKASKKGRQVDTRHVDQLIRNYKKERWVQNTQRLGKADSLSAWYGMEELQSFLQLAKENQADGIKMYFGVYPPDFAEVPEFRGRQTIVLVATKEKLNEKGKTVNKDIYIQNEGKPEILAFNFSSLCPPSCPPNDTSGTHPETIGITILENNNQIIVI